MTKAFNKNVIAIVVTYNRKELLLKCIEALKYQNCDILVVDNASTDGTKEYINKFIKDKSIIYKNTQSNLGGAGGFNFGMKEAIKLGYEYLWLMDDDTIVQKNSLNKLLLADSNLKGDYGFLSSKALWTDGSIALMNKQKTKKKWKNDNKFNLIRTYHATFVSFFIKSSIVKELGLPIKEFFIWGDDVEYSNRISKFYKNYVVNDSIVEHHTKENTGSNIVIDNNRMDRYKYAYRNEAFTARKNGFKAKLRQFLKVNYHILKVLLKSKYKFKKIKLIISSSIKGMKFNPSIEYIGNENRVLEVFGEPFSNGGQESFIMNVYRHIDRSKIQMDFYTPFYCDNENYKKEINDLGGRIFASNGRFINNRPNKKDFVINLNNFLKKHKYDVIHIHSGSTFELFMGSKIARKNGAKRVAIHSHCGGFKNLKYRIVKIISYPFMKKYPTDYFACSTLAANWKFPKNTKYTLFNNGIDTTKMYYDEKIRNKKRKELNIEDKFVVTHIGRFSIQKNHNFLIDIFNKIQKIESNSILLLVGVGELQEEMKQKVKDLNLDKKVKFLNLRTDINEILNASDAFVLPSFFEGLPVVGVESQATGLKVFTSTNVTKELPIDELTYYYSLEDTPKQWAEKIIKETKNFKRKNTTKEIIKSGYDVQDTANKMLKYYLEMKK